MKLLVDECVDERLRLLFPGHDCQTAHFANLAGGICGMLGLQRPQMLDVQRTHDRNISVNYRLKV